MPRRVLVVTSKRQLPPADTSTATEQDGLVWRTEQGVMEALRTLGDDARIIGLDDAIDPLIDTIRSWKPRIVFNLLMELRNEPALEPHVPALLDLLGVACTGCDAAALHLARNKALTKHLLTAHHLPTPDFELIRRGGRAHVHANAQAKIVKPVDLGCSVGVARASIVRTDEAMRQRIQFVHDQLLTDAIVEDFIDGRELTVGLLGNRRITVLPIWETFYGSMPEPQLSTEALKWNQAYRREQGVHTGPAEDLSPRTERRIRKLARDAFVALGMSGFARIDFRLTPDDDLTILEVNPNPDLDTHEDFMRAAAHAGFDSHQVIDRILRLGQAPK